MMNHFISITSDNFTLSSAKCKQNQTIFFFCECHPILFLILQLNGVTKEVMEAIFVTLVVELLSTCIVPGYDLNTF